MLDQLSVSAKFCVQAPIISILAKVRGITLTGGIHLSIDDDIN